MDNIRVKVKEDKIVIKKGWIKKRKIAYYFIFIFLVFIFSILLRQMNILKEGKIVHVVSLMMKGSVVLLYWLYVNKKILPAFILEEIVVDFEKKEFILKNHNGFYCFPLNKIKKIEVNECIQENKEREYGIKILVFDEIEYLFGFALSQTKSKEIKGLLSSLIVRGEIL